MPSRTRLDLTSTALFALSVYETIYLSELKVVMGSKALLVHGLRGRAI
jgi:hypothetical protein